MIILLLTLINGVFSGAELAVLSLRKGQVDQLLERRPRRARAVKFLREHPDNFLATVQVGITVVSAAAAAFGGASLAGRVEGLLRDAGMGNFARPLGFAIVVVGISFLSLVLGELVPKSLGLKYSNGYALLVARPLRAVSWFLRPVIYVLTGASNLVLRLFGDKTSFSESRMSAEELEQAMVDAAKEGTVDPRTGDIASRAFKMAELTVVEVMVPRNQLFSIPKDIGREELLRTLLEGAHTRLPIYDGQKDNIIGYALSAELLAVALGHRRLSEVIRSPYFVPETLPAMTLLQQLQQRRMPIAFVVDELGGVVGIATVEDLVEELVGDIVDEEEEAMPGVRREADGSVVADGATTIRDLNRLMGLRLPEEETCTTIGGLCTVLAAGIPQRSTRLLAGGGVVLEVVEATPRRVKRVRVRHIPQAVAEEAARH